MKNCIVKEKKIIFYLILLCIVTVIVLFKTFALDLSFSFKSITYAGKEYKPMTDALAFHFNVIDYDAKDGEPKDVSLHGPLIEASNVKMQGYGRYHMQLQFNLVGFIEYCHSKFPEVIELILGPIQGDDYNAKINKLKSLIVSGTTKDVLNDFWSTMSSGAYNFDRLQDEFIIRSYIIPAIGKLSLSNSKYKKAFNRDGSFSMSVDDAISDDGELVTALLSSVYSDFNTADLTSASSISIESGDLIPFLYNVDETGYNASEIAKFAYIAYIYGFDTAGRTDGFHYWEQEFEAVLPYESYDLTDDEINNYQQKYDKMSELLSEEKGNKGSRLLGQTITTIIKRDYNIETQVSVVRAKINNILSGFEMETTYKDLIAKNYLMVKHMMDNEHIKDTIKDYEIGTIFRNETSLSQGQTDEKHTNTALLSDFQLVTTSAKIWILGRIGDTDKDGVSDGEELGPEPSEWTDITSIVKAAKSTDGTGGDITESEAKNWETFNDSIKIEWEDAGHSRVKAVLAKLYNYRSNPNLKDTDFDGFDDKEEKGKLPLTNNFKGSTLNTDDGELKVDYNIDFRYLMHNDSKYNDELAQHSLIFSSLADGKTVQLKQGTKDYGTLDIGRYLSKLGFESVLSSTDDTSGSILKYNIGYKIIDYYGKKRGVIGIFLGGLDDENAYNKFVCTSENLSNNSNIYDEIAEIIKGKIDGSKINDFSDYDLKYCYYISGKGTAGGVASTLASKVKTSDIDVYCYTFSSPMTHMGSKTDHLTCIKNIINEDDYLVKVYGVKDNTGNSYYRYGQTYNASIMSNFIYNYRNLTKNNPKYTGDYQKVNSIINSVIDLRTNHGALIDDINTDISKMLAKYVSRKNNSEDMHQMLSNVNTQDLATNIRNKVKNNELQTASSVKSYWTLAKTLEGLDEQTSNGRTYTKTKEDASSEIWDYVEFPCYQKAVGIPINNEVPMYFQTNERWSRFRYGRRENYTDNEGDDNRVMSQASRYSYGTFYESACGACAPAMVLSFLFKKYITPMDVRNRLEDEEVYYRDDTNGGVGTDHSVLTNDIPDIFDVNCTNGEMSNTDANVRKVLKALIEGNPVVAICHGSGSSEYSNHSSYFTTYGHYIVLAGVNKEDIVNIDMEEFDDWTDEDLNDIRIYVCDSAYYHHRNANKRTCTTEYTYNDFTDKKKAGADSFWIYTKDADATYDNDDHWEYRNKNYTETFDPQTYTEYTERGNKEINNPYGVYHWEELTWEYLD